MRQACIAGLGYYLPKKVLSNFDLEKKVNTSDEWIRKRTGIHSRHIAGTGELPSDMAFLASKEALKQASLKAKDLDFIIVATLYPDQLMPNTACVLQKKLHAMQSAALDISAACSGFIYAMSIASQFIQTEFYKNILVVGTETLSKITNYKDRNTCILFGDGAGAFVLSASEKPEKGCIYHQELGTFGELGSLLKLPFPGAKMPFQENTKIKKENACIQMDGAKVFKKAVQIMCELYENALKKTGKTAQQVHWIIAHQANERILKKFCEHTDFPQEKMIFDIQDIGNTSSASIPISMTRAVNRGQIKKGQNILLMAVGGGMTSGSLFLRY